MSMVLSVSWRQEVAGKAIRIQSLAAWTLRKSGCEGVNRCESLASRDKFAVFQFNLEIIDIFNLTKNGHFSDRSQ